MSQQGSLTFWPSFQGQLAHGNDSTQFSHDRLGFAFCLALALHCAVILGVSFSREDKAPAATRLEITLAQHKSKQAPDKADFLAQANQQGSGTLEEKAMLTTQEQADFQDTRIHQVDSPQQISSKQPQTAATASIATTQSRQQKTSNNQQQPRDEVIDKQHNNDPDIVMRSREIASLEAKLDMQRQAYAKRPRIRRLTSMATQQSDDALYLHNWRTRIESIGNLHYPVKARQQKIHGDLRLVVSLLPSGEVHRVKILQSSGHKILDEAAIRIVHLAAPYDPFPRAMARSVDILQIIRTWRFHSGKLISRS